MTTPLDPYAASSSNLPNATQSQIPGNIVGANNTTINTSELNVSSTGGGAVLGYTGTPGVGNLFFSLSVASGTDTYGNAVPTGINASAGSLTGVSVVGAQIDSTSTLQGTQINAPNVLQPTISGGTAASLVHTMSNTNGGVLGYSQSNTAITYATNGNYSWTCPTGITSINIQCWGAGGGGGGGDNSQGGESGGGGEWAQEPSFAVTPGQIYSIIVGQGGTGGSTGNAGQSGGSTTFQNQNGGGSNVTANAGLAGNEGVGGNGGSGSVNTNHFDGGDGANASGNTGGAAGASSASAAGEGVDGNQSSSSTGATPTSPPSGAGIGGTGGNAAGNAFSTGSPGGGGGGAGANSVVNTSKSYPVANPGGTYAYRGSDATTSPNALINHDGPLFQGFPNSAYGAQYSYFILPYAQIQSDLTGVTVTAVSLKLKCLYSYYSGGVYAHIWYTSLSSFGNTGNHSNGSPTLVKNFAMTQNETTTQGFGLNGSIGTALQSGAAKSMMFDAYGLFPAGDYYGSFDSGANNGVIPTLIVYYNNGGGSYGGAGSDGQAILSYGNTTVPTFQLSVSATASADVFGNPYSAGFTGPLLTLTPGSSTPATSTVGATAVGANATSTAVVMTNSPGFTGSMSAAQSDITLNVVTQTSPTQLSKAYNIPAGDPQVGTMYRLSAWGDVHTPAASPQAMKWTLQFGSTQLAGVAYAGTQYSISTFYEWYLTALVQVMAIGGSSSGTLDTWVSVNQGAFGVNQNPALAPPNCAGFAGASSGNAVSTNTNNNLQLLGSWAAVETAQTARCFGSMLERLGP